MNNHNIVANYAIHTHIYIYICDCRHLMKFVATVENVVLAVVRLTVIL